MNFFGYSIVKELARFSEDKIIRICFSKTPNLKNRYRRTKMKFYIINSIITTLFVFFLMTLLKLNTSVGNLVAVFVAAFITTFAADRVDKWRRKQSK